MPMTCVYIIDTLCVGLLFSITVNLGPASLFWQLGGSSVAVDIAYPMFAYVHICSHGVRKVWQLVALFSYFILTRTPF